MNQKILPAFGFGGGTMNSRHSGPSDASPRPAGGKAAKAPVPVAKTGKLSFSSGGDGGDGGEAGEAGEVGVEAGWADDIGNDGDGIGERSDGGDRVFCVSSPPMAAPAAGGSTAMARESENDADTRRARARAEGTARRRAAEGAARR